MANIDIREANEAMLDGMSNFITNTQWNEILVARCSPELKDETKILSPEFIVKYKNQLNFAAFTLYLNMAYDVKKLDTDFIHRFWKYVIFTVGERDSMLSGKTLAGKPSGLKNWAKEAGLDLTNIASILTGDKKPFSMEELDKHPYKYNAALWNASLTMADELSLDFVDKYIHMVNFNSIFTNNKIGDTFKKSLVDKYGAPCQVGNTKYVFFPDGCVMEENDFDSTNQGKSFYSNAERFAVTDSAVRPTVEKLRAQFPRAFEDCMYPENAAVMVDK